MNWKKMLHTERICREEGDVLDPYGGDEDAYEECYAELKDLLYKVKKKLEWQ